MKQFLLFCIFQLFLFSAMGQEKRLALVIGNANYDKGALKNPVNDALLMKETLEELDFFVIFDTNVATISQFNDAARIFGEKRQQYNVGLIYYAGHGVQLDGINYLLATKEEYKSQYDVEDKALNLQKLMRYLTYQTDQVNLLILDACRNNPFEQNWNPKVRSIEDGQGLAKIITPMGSLIAYSTEAGKTAEDGKDKNSIYALSLSKNLKIRDLTLEQVLKNVRKEVIAGTNNRQMPVEESRLLGSEIIFNPSINLEISSLNETINLIERQDLNKRNQFINYVIHHKEFYHKNLEANNIRIHYINKLIESNMVNPKFILNTNFAIHTNYSNQLFFDVLSDSSNNFVINLMKDLNPKFDNDFYNSALIKIKSLYREIRLYIAQENLDKDSCFVNIGSAKMIKEISENKLFTEDKSLYIQVCMSILESDLRWGGKVTEENIIDKNFNFTTNNIHSHIHSLKTKEFIDFNISLLEKIQLNLEKLNPINKIDSTILFINEKWKSELISNFLIRIIQESGSTIDSISLSIYLTTYINILNSLVAPIDFENIKSLEDLTYYHYPLTFSLFQLLGSTTYHFGFSSIQQNLILKIFQSHIANIDNFYKYVLQNFNKIKKSEFRNFINKCDMYLLMNINEEFTNTFYNYLRNNNDEKYLNAKYSKEIYNLWLSEKKHYEYILNFASRKEPLIQEGKLTLFKCDNWALRSLIEFSAGLYLSDRYRILNSSNLIDSSHTDLNYNLNKRDEILEEILNQTIAPYLASFYEIYPDDIDWLSNLDFALWFNFFEDVGESNQSCSYNENIFLLFYLDFITGSNTKLSNTIDFKYYEICLKKLQLCKDDFSSEFKITLNYFLIKTKIHISDYYGEDELNKFSYLAGQIITF
jgi:hypothetical protein